MFFHGLSYSIWWIKDFCREKISNIFEFSKTTIILTQKTEKQKLDKNLGKLEVCTETNQPSQLSSSANFA